MRLAGKVARGGIVITLAGTGIGLLGPLGDCGSLRDLAGRPAPALLGSFSGHSGPPVHLPA